MLVLMAVMVLKEGKAEVCSIQSKTGESPKKVKP